MPVQRCKVKGKLGWKWGQSGKCYVGPAARQKAAKQGYAAKQTGWTENVQRKRPAPNPLRADPTRTATLRRMFETELSRRFNRIKRKIMALVDAEDVFGLRERRPFIVHTRWQFRSTPVQVQAFQVWLQAQIEADLLLGKKKEEDAYWQAYVEQGYRKGAGRAFDDTHAAQRAAMDEASAEQLAWYQGTREEFLRASFARPVAVEKVKLLAGRVFTELKGVTQAMATTITRALTDGLAQGQNPREIARRMIAEGIGTKVRGVQSRALTIARTEIIRAHAEGQLDAMERLGVEEVGVVVEWSTAGDARVCRLCQPLEGVVLKIKEARGLIPRHPNCRCAHVPANVGESTRGQTRSKGEIQKSILQSIKAEMPKKTKRTIAQQKKRTRWAGADKRIDKRRPKALV